MPFYRSIVCPRSSDPFLYSKLLQKTGHYVLNIHYLYNSIDIRTIPGTMNTLSWKPGYIYDIYQNVCQQSCCNCCVASWIMFKHMNHVQQTYTGVDWERCTFHTECSIIKDNTVNRLNIRVRLCSHHLSFHLKMQIPMNSNQVTVYEWALEFMYTKK